MARRRRTRLIALFIVLVGSLGPVWAQAGQPPTVVPFRLLRGFAVIVPVSINGRAPVELLLDTGSSRTSIDEDLARSLGLSASGEVEVATLLGKTSAYTVRVSSVSIGGAADGPMELLVNDVSAMRDLDPNVRGVLGQDVLSHRDFLLDFRAARVVFERAGPDGGLLARMSGPRTRVVSLPAPGNPQVRLPAVAATVEMGYHMERRMLLLDSGAAFLVLFADQAPQRQTASPTLVADEQRHERLLASEEVLLGVPGHRLRTIAQVMPMRSVGSEPQGLLSLALFGSVLVANSRGFVIFDPRP